MKDVAVDDRPREKLARLGPSALGDNELLALVLGHGAAARGALELANTLLTRAGGARGLLRLTDRELRQIPGVGPARAAQVLAALELGRRTLLPDPLERRQFVSPRQIADWLIPQYGACPVEQFGVILLDTRLQLLATRIISVGSLDASPAHPRDVFREAVATRAAFVVLFHNHPSGDPSPSAEDVQLTAQLTDAGDLLGIGVLDHVIVGATGYFSFKEQQRGESEGKALRLRRRP